MWELIFTKPIFNLLIAIYSILPVRDLGLAVIGVVIVIRLILFPLSKKAVRTQVVMQKLQPEVAAIQKKYKGDRESETKALLALYRDHKVNPFASILVLFLQIPILIALYRVFLDVVVHPNGITRLLWSFMPNPGEINSRFLGIVDLASTSPFLPLIAAIFQFFQTKRMTPTLSPAEHSAHSFQTLLARQMLYIGPVFTLLILWQLPAVVGLYWAVTSLWSIGEYHFTLKPDQEKQEKKDKIES
jgi:YidC/Oxa1 family membrane protein insertase